MDQYLRLAFFIFFFLFFGIWELLAPKRRLLEPLGRKARWPLNIGMQVLNASVIKFCFPWGLLSLAWWVEKMDWGLFHVIEVGWVVESVLCFFLLDFTIYWQHRLFHRFSLFWRFHRIHHSDPCLDVSSAGRFHIIEIFLSLIIKATIIFIFGVSANVVFIFEIVLNGMAQFNHSNISLPHTVDKYLRYLLVTSDMHRVHHSTNIREEQSNFGFNLSCWDYIFGSYCSHPGLGHQEMSIGLEDIGPQDSQNWRWLLTSPFNNGQGSKRPSSAFSKKEKK